MWWCLCGAMASVGKEVFFFFFTGKVLANGLMKGIGLMSLVMRRRVVHWDFVMDLNLVLITEHFGLEDFA